MITAENMVRVGVVSAVNSSKKTARVTFPESNNLVSGWLFVLQHPVSTSYSGGHTHSCPDGTTGSAGSHSHSVSSWFPSVNDRVLCLLQCGSETDGYILGAIP